MDSYIETKAAYYLLFPQDPSQPWLLSDEVQDRQACLRFPEHHDPKLPHLWMRTRIQVSASTPNRRNKRAPEIRRHPPASGVIPRSFS